MIHYPLKRQCLTDANIHSGFSGGTGFCKKMLLRKVQVKSESHFIKRRAMCHSPLRNPPQLKTQSSNRKGREQKFSRLSLGSGERHPTQLAHSFVSPQCQSGKEWAPSEALESRRPLKVPQSGRSSTQLCFQTLKKIIIPRKFKHFIEFQILNFKPINV